MSVDLTSSFLSVMGMSEAIVAAATEAVHTPNPVNEIPVVRMPPKGRPV